MFGALREVNMKCPSCYNALQSQPVGRTTVDVCQGGCGGIWLDAFELGQVDGAAEAVDDLVLSIEIDPGLQVDASRKRECPRCAGVKLKKRFFSPRRLVEIDECPGCGGIWLDAGELEKIRAELEETRLVQRTQAQKPELTMAVIRYLYRARTAQE